MHESCQSKIEILSIFLFFELAFPFVGCTSVNTSETIGGILSVPNFTQREVIQRIPAQLSVSDTESVPKEVFLVGGKLLTQISPEFSSERTPSALVNSIMALLATFETADILPPEGTSQANQLIHGLIQLQAALVKSQSSVLTEYALAAIAQKSEIENDHHWQSIQQNGLTSKMLEALLLYDKKKPIWNQSAIVRILHSYNFFQSDWQLIEYIFSKADAALRAEGTSIHAVYEQWWLRMRGNR
jgi:hypothetical protein